MKSIATSLNKLGGFYHEEYSVVLVLDTCAAGTLTATVWPLTVPASPPIYFNTFLDPSWKFPLNNGNLSHFYRRISGDQFIIYGNPVLVETQYPESYYIGQRGLGSAYGLANAEVLQALDGQIDCADYDNWTFTPYDPIGHHPGPDGNVDLIIMFYRNSSFPGGSNGYGASGIAKLGDEADFQLDGKWIRFGFPGSGVTNGGGWSGQSLFSTRHELGHLLFGAGHPSHGKNPCGYPDNYGFYGIMSSNPQLTPTAYELERMRWINYNDRPTGISYGPIADFLTAKVAYRILIPGTDQAFIIENHQKVDTFFDDPNGPWPGKGLFIYRVDGLDYNHPHYDLMSGEGDFNWSNPSSRKYDNSLTDIAIEITSKSIGPNRVDIFNLVFYNGNNTAIQSSPSKPQDMQVASSGGHPRSTWAQMQESDVLSGGNILVEQRTRPLYEPWSSWTQIASLSGNATEYTDYSIQQGCVGNCPDSVQYRIRAKDNTGKFSVYSDIASMTYYYYKVGGETSTTPVRYALFDAYPNPFNPETVFKFQLPEDSQVFLAIYDVLGQRVAELTNGFFKSGYHSATWNASSFASGIYLARFVAMDVSGAVRLSTTQKLMLTK